MENLFQELASRLKSGTLNLSIQMENGTMAVMATFKGIQAKPRVIRGTAKEIDESFIDQLESDLAMVNNFNILNEDLDAVIKQMLKDKQKQTEDKDAAKKATEKKKTDKAEAVKNQTSILDQASKKVDVTKAGTEIIDSTKGTFEADLLKANMKHHDKVTGENKAGETPEEDYSEFDPKDSEIKIPFRLSQKDRRILLEEFEEKSTGPWDVMDIGIKKIIELKKCTAEQAEESLRRSGLPKEFLTSPEGSFKTKEEKPAEKKEEIEPDTITEKVPFDTSDNHKGNVASMKADMGSGKVDLDDDDEFSLDDEIPEEKTEKPQTTPVDDFEDDDDEFEL